MAQPRVHRVGMFSTPVQENKFRQFPSGLGQELALPFTSIVGGRQERRLNVFRPPALPRTCASLVTAGGGAAPSAVVGLTKATTPILPQITFEASARSPTSYAGDLLLFGVFEDALDVTEGPKFSLAALQDVDKKVEGLLLELAAEGDFKGKVGQSVVARLQGSDLKRVGLVGLGKAGQAAGPAPWLAVGAALAAAAKQAKAVSAGVAILGADISEEAKVAATGAIVRGTVLSCFEDSRFKSEVKPPTLASVAIMGLPSEEAEAEIGRAVRLAAGVILTKQLVNAPPNVLTPSAMAEVAEGIASAHSDVITLKVLEADECEVLGMGGFLGVAAASENPPKFIHLTYTPEGPIHKKLALVGKGLTFDSGGYNLKTGPGCLIQLMKFDMGGAGAVLGAAKAIGAIQPKGVEVHFIVASCENMISGGGMRPGDILTASNGKTIEVGNTDAEGRLTLADALVYACKLEVDAVIDLATLTGACITALGGSIAGLFSPSDPLSEEVLSASSAAGEKMWRMPMEDSYMEQLKSHIADINNVGGAPAGAITAALFLKEFVPASTPWVHLDIAGPVWDGKAGCSTGYGVATLVKWVQTHAKAAGAAT